jgi:1-aminocyclopropane-1-carboxylate deaminase
MPLVLNKPVLQSLHDSLFKEKKLNVFVLRDDLIHPFISGNKWRKLKYNIEEFQKEEKEWLVTFGGAYSNHIVATACAGKESGIKTIGIIRGEELNEKANSALRFATECGMKLIFVSRDEYSNVKKLEDGGSRLDKLLKSSNIHLPTSTFYFLPEGGSNDLAVKGCSEIIDDVDTDFDYICCACGTGATFAGIINGINNNQKAIGIAVLKGGQFIAHEIKKWTGERTNFQLMDEYHFGGYAKSTRQLEDFCNSIIETTHIPIEPVYTGKLFFGIYDLIQKNFFPEHKTIVIVHTGGMGLTGIRTQGTVVSI